MLRLFEFLLFRIVTTGIKKWEFRSGKRWGFLGKKVFEEEGGEIERRWSVISGLASGGFS
jgi:hypothetical protein